jgi:hypothetical protein
METVITRKDDLTLNGNSIKELCITTQGVICGTTTGPEIINISTEGKWDVKTTVSFRKRSIGLDAKKVLSIKEEYPCAVYDNKDSLEFNFFFSDTEAYKKKVPLSVKVRLEGCNFVFPEVLREQRQSLNLETGIKIHSVGPGIEDINQVLKMDTRQFNEEKFGFKPGEFAQTRNLLLEVMKFKNEIIDAAGMMVDLAEIMENDKIKGMIAKSVALKEAQKESDRQFTERLRGGNQSQSAQ